MTLPPLTRLVATAAAALLAIAAAGPVASSVPSAAPVGTDWHIPRRPSILDGYKNVVVIFQENHSFDNLYGSWGKVGKSRVDGPRHATAAQKRQIGQDGKVYKCLLQNDVNLTSPAAPSHLRGHRPRHRRQRIPQPTLHDRRLHRADGHDLPGTGSLRTKRSPERHR